MKKRCLGRKGYFFLIDSIIALGVLAVGVFLVFALYVNVPPIEQPAILSDDIMDFFANNKIKDVDNAYAGLGGTLWKEGKITNGENTLLQQIGEFYEKSKDDAAYLDITEQFIAELIQNVFPKEYSFEFWIHDLGVDTLIYPKNPSPEHLNSKEATEVIIPSKKIVYGILNKETGDMFGPYNAEVLVWQ